MSQLPCMRNNREHESTIGEYRVSAGLTISDVCKLANISIDDYVRLQNGTKSPFYLRDKMGLKPQVLRLCDILNCKPEEAFPRYFCKIGNAEEKLLYEQQYIEEFEERYGQDVFRTIELKILINEALDKLNSKDRKILEKRFGLNGEKENTLNEISEYYFISMERVRQIVARALRVLRHPKIGGKLKHYV